MKNTQVIPSTFFQHTPWQPMMTCCKQLLLLEQPCLTLLVKPFILIIEPYMQQPAFTKEATVLNFIIETIYYYLNYACNSQFSPNEQQCSNLSLMSFIVIITTIDTIVSFYKMSNSAQIIIDVIGCYYYKGRHNCQFLQNEQQCSNLSLKSLVVIITRVDTIDSFHKMSSSAQIYHWSHSLLLL